MTGERGQWRAIAQKDYVLTVLAAIVFIYINFIFLSLAPVYTVSVGHSRFLAGFQNTFFSLLCVVFRFYLAPLADRKGRKAMMLLGSAAFVAGPLVFWGSGGAYGLILAGRVLMAVGMASFLSSVSCYIAETVPDRYRGFAIGLQRAGYSVALMVAPFTGLLIADGPWGFRGLFGFSAGMGVLSVLLLTAVHNRKVEHCEVNHVRTDTLTVLRSSLNRRIYYSILNVCLAYGVLLSYITLFLGNFRQLPNPGIYFTVFAGSGLLGSVLAGMLSDWLSREAIARPILMGMGVGIATLYLTPLAPVPVSLISGLIAGMCFTGGVSVLVSWLIDITPDHLRGTALGLQESCIDAGIALGSLVFGAITLVVSPQMGFLLLGVFGFFFPLLIKSAKVVPNP